MLVNNPYIAENLGGILAVFKLLKKIQASRKIFESSLHIIPLQRQISEIGIYESKAIVIPGLDLNLLGFLVTPLSFFIPPERQIGVCQIIIDLRFIKPSIYLVEDNQTVFQCLLCPR